VVERSTLSTKLEAPSHVQLREPATRSVTGSGDESVGAAFALRKWLLKRSAAPRIYLICVVAIGIASFAMLSPALRGTLLADDWDHYAMQQSIYPVPTPPWDMFRFVADSDGARRVLLDSGRLPWWSSSDLHLAVFRPLSSLLITADFAWLGGHDRTWLMHLHSLVWWLVLFAAVAALYRRFLPVPLAALALLVFAVDDAHVYPVVWLANRSELVSVALVCWGIWAHVSAVESTHRRRALQTAAWLLVALGLLAGEHAIAPLSYLIAYELCRDRAPWGSAIRRLLPYAGLTVAYLAARAYLDYGVSGSAFYVDPIRDPIRYLQHGLTRIPLLVGDLLLGIAAEWWYWGIPYVVWVKDLLPAAWIEFPLLQKVQVALGIASLISACAGMVWAFYASRCSARLRTCWSLLLGAALSLIPLAGTAPMTRLTVVPAIAIDALIAVVLWKLCEKLVNAHNLWSRSLTLLVSALGIILHLVRPAVHCVQGTRYLTNSSHLEYGWTTKADFGDQDVRQRHVFFVSAHDMAAQYLMPYLMHAARLPIPLTSHLLSPAAENAHVLTRVAENVLDVQFPEPITNAPFAPMVYRQAGTGFFPGQTFHNALFDVEVKLARGVEPRQLRFTFRSSLDDPKYLFVYPTREGIEPVSLPVVGKSIRLKSPAWPQ
jgi:hypothetical protein